jgi:hypothetical protein
MFPRRYFYRIQKIHPKSLKRKRVQTRCGGTQIVDMTSYKNTFITNCNRFTTTHGKALVLSFALQNSGPRFLQRPGLGPGLHCKNSQQNSNHVNLFKSRKFTSNVKMNATRKHVQSRVTKCKTVVFFCGTYWHFICCQWCGRVNMERCGLKIVDLSNEPQNARWRHNMASDNSSTGA